MGTKSTPDLVLPKAQETAIFRTVEHVLARDPLLSSHVNTFLAMRGEDQDFFEPAVSLCPYLEIAPWPTESGWLTEGQHESPLTVRIMCAVKGTNSDNLMNFWAAVRAALFPQVQPQRGLVIAQFVAIGVGVSRPTIRLNAYGATKDKEGLRMCIADGTVTFWTAINT